MRKAFIAALLVSAGSLMVPAYADSTQFCGGNSDCNATNNQGGQGGQGGTGVGIAGANAGAAAINHNDITAQGGKGGNANAGAVSGSLANAENNNHNIAKGGEGIGVGISGAAANAENNNHNIAKGGTANAGAISGSLSSSENHNNNLAKGGEANAGAVSGSVSGAKVDNDVRNTNKQGQHQSSESNSNSKSESSSSSDNANNASQSVNFEAQERAPVNTAYAAPLVSGEDTCMGSSSIGGQGVGFGISIGTTWTDENCQRLKNSRQLAAMGFRRASVALLCVNDDVARAMAAAGQPCRVENGDEWQLSTVGLPADPSAYVPPAPRVVYSTVVHDKPHYAPKKRKVRKSKCRLVRQCHR